MDEPGSKLPTESVFQARSNGETFFLVASTRATSAKPEPIAEPARFSRLLAANLVALILLGVLFCGWTLRYTDWFPVIGGILTLSGALSWLAFVANVVPEEELGELRRRVFESFFQSKLTFVILLGLSLAGLVVTSLFGAVQLEPLQQAIDRQVWIQPLHPNGRYEWNRERDFDRLAVGGSLRALRFSGWSGQRYLVKVSGYPAREVELKSWGREELFLPSSFRRPVILLRPGKELLDILVNNPMTLQVATASFTNEIPLIGSAIWIGCDADVQVPSDLIDSWARGPNPGLVNLWLPAVALGDVHRRLHEQETVQIRLFKKNSRELFVEKRCLVRAVAPTLDFQPQEEDIDAR